MTNPKRISVGPVGEHIALARWGEDGSGKPPALLLHGTGFVAEVWNEPVNWRRVTPSMRSTAAAMATVTSQRPAAITSRISPRMCVG
jgi:hypothetical protein